MMIRTYRSKAPPPYASPEKAAMAGTAARHQPSDETLDVNSCGCWTFFCRLLLWAMRNNR